MSEGLHGDFFSGFMKKMFGILEDKQACVADNVALQVGFLIWLVFRMSGFYLRTTAYNNMALKHPITLSISNQILFLLFFFNFRFFFIILLLSLISTKQNLK